MNNKNLWITLAVIVVLLVGLFVFFAVKPGRNTGTINTYSFTHLVLKDPTEGQTADWVEFERIITKRVDRYADIRYIGEYGDNFMIDITGATDPNYFSSVLLTPAHVLITTEGGDQVASSPEIEMCRSIQYQEEPYGLGLYFKLNEAATERLKEATDPARPDNIVILKLSVDGQDFLESEAPIPITTGELQFPMPETADAYTTDLFAFMLEEELPFEPLINIGSSYFIPPKAATQPRLSLRMW